MELSIVPAGDIEDDLLESLKDYLEFIGFQVSITEKIPIPEKAYNNQRDQYIVYPFIEIVNRLKGHHLVITDVDLYTQGLNFIFGYGSGPNAIISIFRLKGALLEERTIKEALHELGHVFSLGHCPTSECVMHFSNSLQDTDYNSNTFCPECRKLWPFKQ
jgi:archaemetzincin